MDSTKLLTEKLALSRELGAIKPELEHLRSQALMNQNLLAEKLTLQRQLSTAELELENERRSNERALARADGRQEQETKLQDQLDNALSELAKEKRERQRMDRELQKMTTEFESKKTVLESRVDAFRTKLRITKDQLKETQVSLAESKSSLATLSAKQPSTEVAPRGRKRAAAQHLEEPSAVGTPGIAPAAKKNKRTSTLPGDKSMFSLTPFMNRNTSIALGDPEDEEVEQEDDAGDDAVKPTTAVSPFATQAAGRKRAAKVTTQAPKTSILTAVKPSATNVGAKRAARTKAVPALGDVREEENDEDAAAEQVFSIHKQPVETIAVSKTSLEEPSFIMKKRKVLAGGSGRTIFDEDDGESAKPGRVALGGGYRLLPGRGGAASIAKPRIGITQVTGGFGTFSPLKKDRKAA